MQPLKQPAIVPFPKHGSLNAHTPAFQKRVPAPRGSAGPVDVNQESIPQLVGKRALVNGCKELLQPRAVIVRDTSRERREADVGVFVCEGAGVEVGVLEVVFLGAVVPVEDFFGVVCCGEGGCVGYEDETVGVEVLPVFLGLDAAGGGGAPEQGCCFVLPGYVVGGGVFVG